MRDMMRCRIHCARYPKFRYGVQLTDVVEIEIPFPLAERLRDLADRSGSTIDDILREAAERLLSVAPESAAAPSELPPRTS